MQPLWKARFHAEESTFSKSGRWHFPYRPAKLFLAEFAAKFYKPIARPMLELQHFLIKERVAFMKTTDTYDIFDPETGKQVGVASEVIPAYVSILRLLLPKKLMPTKVEVREHPEGALVFTIRKPVAFFRETVEVYDAQDEKIGRFQSKLFVIGGGFWVYDQNDKQFAEVKGKWTGWEFRFVTPDGVELGQVSKKWAGVLKELFTSADNYIVSVADHLAEQPIAKMLLLAAALAIDIVYYERGGAGVEID